MDARKILDDHPQFADLQLGPMPLILSAHVAAELRKAPGWLPHDVIVTIDPPARWPLDREWPPKVTVPGAPCWRCAAHLLRV